MKSLLGKIKCSLGFHLYELYYEIGETTVISYGNYAIYKTPEKLTTICEVCGKSKSNGWI